MSDIIKRQSGAIAEFDPTKTKLKLLTLEAAINHAIDMEDWETGTEAAEWMVKEQQDFVAWWNGAVGVRHRPGNTLNADRRSTLSADKAEEQTKISQQQVSRWRKELARPEYAKRGKLASHKKFMNWAREAEGRAGLQTGQMEWFTPSKYIELARDVLGEIDLDPASNPTAQEWIRAKTFYTVEDDGLKQEWKGRVWLNPPYAGKLVKAFAEKMIESVSSGDVSAAIMLTNSYTETSWFHDLASIAAAICFTRGRIKFESPKGEKCAPTNGQAFFYFGENLQKFKEKFLEVGLSVVEA